MTHLALIASNPAHLPAAQAMHDLRNILASIGLSRDARTPERTEWRKAGGCRVRLADALHGYVQLRFGLRCQCAIASLPRRPDTHRTPDRRSSGPERAQGLLLRYRAGHCSLRSCRSERRISDPVQPDEQCRKCGEPQSERDQNSNGPSRHRRRSPDNADQRRRPGPAGLAADTFVQSTIKAAEFRSTWIRSCHRA